MGIGILGGFQGFRVWGCRASGFLWAFRLDGFDLSMIPSTLDWLRVTTGWHASLAGASR